MRLRKFIPLMSIIFFLVLTSAGIYYVRLRILEKHMTAEMDKDDKASIRNKLPEDGKLVERHIRNLETDLKLPEHARGVQRSANGQGWAYIRSNEGKSQVVHNGKEGQAYEVIQLLQLSPDGRRVAYRVERKGPPFENFVVCDGAEGRKYAYVNHLVFSADGEHLAYLALRDEKWLIVRDGVEREIGTVRGPRERGRHPEVVDSIHMPYSVSFSPDGRHLLWIVKRDDKTHAVIDGIQGPPHARLWTHEVMKDAVRFMAVDEQQVNLVSVDWPTDARPPGADLVERRVKALGRIPEGAWLEEMNARGTHILSIRSNGAGSTLFLDERELGTWDSIGKVEFSPDGEHASYVAERGGQQYIGWDDKASPMPKQTGQKPSISPDGRHYALRCWRDGKVHAVLDGQEGPAYDRMSPELVFSPDGTRFAYGAGRDDEDFLVLDGKELKKYAGGESCCRGVYNVVFSPDSRHVAYAVLHKEHRTAVCVDDRQIGIYGPMPELVVSSDGKLAFSADDEQGGFIWCDGRVSRAWGAGRQLRFSADGRHLAFVAQRDKKAFVVCDGVAGPPHDSVELSPESPRTDDVLRYTVRDGEGRALVEVAWPAGADWTHGFKERMP